MIVVDTQAVIWVTQEPRRLSQPAARVLVEAYLQGDAAIADITLREIAFLVARKRILLSEPLEMYLSFVQSRFTVLPITAKIAERSMQFGSGYPSDPADMLIGATAVIHGATLITADEQIRASGEVNCVW